MSSENPQTNELLMVTVSGESSSSSSRSSTNAVVASTPAPTGTEMMGAETAAVARGGGNGGSGTTATMASQSPPSPGGRDSFLAELSLLEAEAAADPTPSTSSCASMLQSLRLALADEGQEEEGCEAPVHAPSRHAKKKATTSPIPPGPSPPVQTSPAPDEVEEVPLGTSWTWRYFRLPEGVGSPREATSVVCALCNAMVKRGRPGKSGMGTSALASHLAHRHRITKGQGPPSPAATPTTTTAAAASASAGRRRTSSTPAATDTVTIGTTAAASTSHDATPTDSLHHGQWPQGCSEGFFGAIAQVCEHCGKTLSRGERQMETLVGVLKHHMRRHHPEVAKQCSAWNRHCRERDLKGKGPGKKRVRDTEADNDGGTTKSASASARASRGSGKSAAP